jgi:release factor glutamine methyltransferase
MKLSRLPFKALRTVHDPLMARLRCSPLIARTLFGINVRSASGTPLWDYTTLVMRKAVRRHLRSGMCVWDVGCGPAAIMAMFVSRLAPDVEIVASDREAACIPLAQEVVRRSAVDITVIQSDLGAQVRGEFDLIMFNPPYLPLANVDLMPEYRLKADPLRPVFEQRFGGGDDGHEVIARFLAEAPDKLTDNGRVLLGINRMYVSSERVHALAEERGLELLDSYSAWLNPSTVLVFRRPAGS